MDQEQALKRIEKAINKLTVAVWAAVIVILVTSIISISSYMFVPPPMPKFNMEQLGMDPSAENPIESSAHDLVQFSLQKIMEQEEAEMRATATAVYEEFDYESQIDTATVIALAEYEGMSAAGSMKAIVKEFLKQDAELLFPIGVGDEHPFFRYRPVDEGGYQGDGVIIFFEGNPAQMRYSTQFIDDRVPGIDNITLNQLRDKIQQGSTAAQP